MRKGRTVLDYKKKNDCKLFHSSAKLFDSDSKVFIAIQQSIMTKIKNYASEDWIVFDVTIKGSIKISEC